MKRTVVGAVLVDLSASSVLAARRAGPAELAGLWEFPGGKVESGESPEEALRREVREELSVDIEVLAELGTWPISAAYDLLLFLARSADNPVPGDDHDEVRWLTAEELDDVAWLPSDQAALPSVRRALRSGHDVSA